MKKLQVLIIYVGVYRSYLLDACAPAKIKLRLHVWMTLNCCCSVFPTASVD